MSNNTELTNSLILKELIVFCRVNMHVNMWNTDLVTKSRDAHSVYVSAEVSHLQEALELSLEKISQNSKVVAFQSSQRHGEQQPLGKCEWF